MRYHFYGNLREEAPFCLFILSKAMLAVGWRFMLWFMVMVTWRTGCLDQVILLVWPKYEKASRTH